MKAPQLKGALIATVLSSALLQSCAGPSALEREQERQFALQRLSLCVQRFDQSSPQSCEGHKRDVLATYPLYLEKHVSEMLNQRHLQKHLSGLLKTASPDPRSSAIP